uniref:Reverse transcriptase Ty1/copia-type domain-containing protein n=1 Tax=Vitis vinifera TaxID=29760 RepID=A5BZ65_VITVI|nr:hypothetical protein VITISV_033832 [Vitis vinifera]
MDKDVDMDEVEDMVAVQVVVNTILLIVVVLKKAQIIQEALEEAYILKKKPLKRHMLNKKPLKRLRYLKNCEILKSKTGFAIIAVYVDDLNLIGTLEELTRESEQQLLGYADAEYLSDPYKGFVPIGFIGKVFNKTVVVI